MTPCFAVDDIKTPKGFILRGLWFGPKKPKRVIIFIHGLGGSMWSRFNLLQHFVDRHTAVLTFSNRGHDKVAFIPHTNNRRGIKGGSAHEVFTDSVDDLQGAITFVRKQGVKNMFLAGHSTGCQKSIYWAYKKVKGVKGIILLAPISDFSAGMALEGKKRLAYLENVARSYMKKGRKHDMLPQDAEAPMLLGDAQRFLSLYTPDSVEEIFSYAQPKKNPRVLRSVKLPILALLAQNDEHADRPAEDIAAWLDSNIKAKHQVIVIPDVKHSFKGGEKRVAKEIREFISQ